MELRNQKKSYSVLEMVTSRFIRGLRKKNCPIFEEIKIGQVFDVVLRVQIFLKWLNLSLL